MSPADISEAKTRQEFIDKALRKAGWDPIVPFQPGIKCNHGSVEEYPTKNGPADYILFSKGIPLACVEGKKVRIGPQNVLQQAKRYARGFEGGPHSFGGYNLPFVYSTNGKIIWFQDLGDPQVSQERFLLFILPKPFWRC